MTNENELKVGDVLDCLIDLKRLVDKHQTLGSDDIQLAVNLIKSQQELIETLTESQELETLYRNEYSRTHDLESAIRELLSVHRRFRGFTNAPEYTDEVKNLRNLMEQAK